MCIFYDINALGTRKTGDQAPSDTALTLPESPTAEILP